MTAVWRMAALVGTAVACASRLEGQASINRSPQAAASQVRSVSVASARDSAGVWKAWIGLAVGSIRGSVDDQPNPIRMPTTGGELALWVTRNHLAVGARLAGTISDDGPGTGDASVLVGYHVEPIRRIDGIVAIGVGSNSLTQFLSHYPDQPVVVASAQLVANFYVVGLGVDAFAAAGQHRRYAGIGTTLCLGWFR